MSKTIHANTLLAVRELRLLTPTTYILKMDRDGLSETFKEGYRGAHLI